MNFNTIADKVVFKSLKFIKYGSIELINYDNKKYFFGSSKEELKVKIKKFRIICQINGFTSITRLSDKNSLR